MWARRDNGIGVNWYQANNYCHDLSLVNFWNWQLPTIDELAGIYDQTQNVNGYHIAGGIRLSDCCSWSSTIGDASGAVWYFYFFNGLRLSAFPDHSGDTRTLCVRHP
jgi:hypothetical protein